MTQIVIKKAQRKGTEGILGKEGSNTSIWTEDVHNASDDEWAAAVNKLMESHVVVSDELSKKLKTKKPMKVVKRKRNGTKD